MRQRAEHRIDDGTQHLLVGVVVVEDRAVELQGIVQQPRLEAHLVGQKLSWVAGLSWVEAEVATVGEAARLVARLTLT